MLFDDSREPDIRTLVRETTIENLYVVPGSLHLSNFNIPEPLKCQELQFAVRDFVQSVDEYFDVILIDTPPDIHNLPAWAALMAADYVLTPVQPLKNPMESITDVNVQVANAIDNGNPNLILLGYFITNFQRRRKIQQKCASRIRQLFRTQVFGTELVSRPTFEEAPFALKPVTHYQPKSEAAKLVRELLIEVVERMGQYSGTSQNIDELRTATG